MYKEYNAPDEQVPTGEVPVRTAEHAQSYVLIGRTASAIMTSEAQRYLLQKYQLESDITAALSEGGAAEGQSLQVSVHKNVAGNRAVSIRNRLGWLAEINYMSSGDPLITSRFGESDTEPVKTFASTSDMEAVSELLERAVPAQVTALDLVRNNPAVIDRFTIAGERISPEHDARLAMIEVGKAIVSLSLSRSSADRSLTPHSATLQGTTERSASPVLSDAVSMKYWATARNNATATAMPVDITATIAVSEQIGDSLRRQVLSVSTDNGQLIKQLFTEEGGRYGPVSTTTDTPVLASRSFGRALRNFLRDPHAA
jgi:hypothetical protein